jgi:hypothetical protein
MLILQSASVDIGILSRATAFDAHQKIDLALSGNKIAANSGPEHRQTLNGVARSSVAREVPSSCINASNDRQPRSRRSRSIR